MVFYKVMNEPILSVNSISWNQFKPDINFKQKGDFWLPRGLKFKIKFFYKFLFKKANKLNDKIIFIEVLKEVKLHYFAEL